MDTSHLYMFVDYDGVVKTYAENFPDELHDENMPFSMSMIRATVQILPVFPACRPILCRSVPVRAV